MLTTILLYFFGSMTVAALCISLLILIRASLWHNHFLFLHWSIASCLAIFTIGRWLFQGLLY